MCSGWSAGALVPRLIAWVPEPEPEPEAAAGGRRTSRGRRGRAEPEEPKELYVDIAARPGLLWKSALAAAVSAAVIGLVLGWSWSLLVVLPLVPVGVALAVIDWRTRMLPTRLIAPTYAVTLVAILVAWLLRTAGDLADLERAGLGWLIYGGMFFVLWFVYPRGLGYGDVRLSGVLGLALGWVGWAELLLGIWTALLLGGVRRRTAGAGDPAPGLPVRSVHAASAPSWASSSDSPSCPPSTAERMRTMLRWLTAGESHGPSLVAILEGLPAHVRVTSDDIRDALARRRLGYGRGARMKFEQDEVTLVGGIRHGETQGGPVAIQIGNTEWPKWEKVMSADPVDPAELEGSARNAPLTRPRPGHADLAGMQKYAFDEARPVLERASARETAARVALGRVASNFLEQAVGARIVSHVIELGGVRAPDGLWPEPDDVARLDDDPVRCLDPDTGKQMVERIDQAHEDGDTLGGVVEVVVHGLPPGLGSHVHWDRRLDSRLAGALMGIQAIKGVEVGDGFALAATPGSLAHDEMVPTDDGIRRLSGRSGGTEGGMTTGEVLRVRAAMKPIATVPRALRTVDVATGEEAVAHHQRSDVCAVPAAGIVAEAMVALVLADAVLEKFGGDSVQETRRNAESYLDTLRFK